MYLDYNYESPVYKLLVGSFELTARLRAALPPLCSFGCFCPGRKRSGRYLGRCIDSEVYKSNERDQIDTSPTIPSEFRSILEGRISRRRQQHPCVRFSMCTKCNHQEDGVFMSCFGLGGARIGVASTATSLDSSPVKHQKLGGSGWTYHGRSYGVTPAVGLVDLLISPLVNYASFNYTENGPSTFTVSVNLTPNIIEVSPVTTNSTPTNIEPTGNLTTNAFLALNVLSQISSNNAISVLGNAVTFNQPNGAARYPLINAEQVTTRSLEDSLIAIIDDLLVAFGAAQTVEITTPLNVPLSATYSAIRIGSNKYIFATLGINLVLLALVAIEAYRTRLWSKMTKFNFRDIGSVVVAASAGGCAISETSAALRKASQISWEDDSSKRATGKIYVKFMASSNKPVIADTGSQELELKDSSIPLKNHNTT
ncbi:uncharacterized protein PAC_12724 [Phialocephala subalpina]|uniref:Uncharacterized protein n=1 Tax=Phialocephala subalpina TaxID=576137 RepID=A0A1L7XCY3_9HELO|nr:uncharacterized protein PAC_12724 [Phialocephala subalpina]